MQIVAECPIEKNLEDKTHVKLRKKFGFLNGTPPTRRCFEEKVYSKIERNAFTDISADVEVHIHSCVSIGTP